VAPLLTVEQALERVLERVRPLNAETVPLDARAAGRVLAEPTSARVDLPPFPSSAMDGFALRAADAPGPLPVVARIAAGRPEARDLLPGEAMAIATGGVVPAGADAVVPIELVEVRGDRIELSQPVGVGDNVRPRGGDVRAGEVALAAGLELTPLRLAALAAAGVPEVSVGRRPQVAVIATGTELRAPGEPLAAGEIYESNGVLLEAALTSAGAVVQRLPVVADDEEAHRAAFARGLVADVLVTSGGVSVGPHDLVRRIEAELAVEEVFWGVAMRPGKPIAFGVKGDTLVFGLPGNPVSSLVGCLLFVRPAVLALQGVTDPAPSYLPGVLAVPLRRNPTRDDFVRARTAQGEAGVELTPVTGQESHMIVRAAGAAALVQVPCGEGELAAGTVVRYLPL
jgi:molybdopterin molybdotransferase